MTKRELFWYSIGELNNNQMLVELGVRDLAEMKIRKEHKDELIKHIKYGVGYRFIPVTEEMYSLILWKYDIVEAVLDEIEKIDSDALRSYLYGKMFGYATSEIIITDH